jgi:hypothetical protein
MKLNNAKVGASTLAACECTPVQWKIALGWMRDANMAASGRESHGLLTPPATHKIAEYHLDTYFEMVETQLSAIEKKRPIRRAANIKPWLFIFT